MCVITVTGPNLTQWGNQKSDMANGHNFSPHMVYKKLLDINPGKSPGPEGWPLIGLREAAEQICISLSILFTQSLETGLLP